MSRNEEAYKHPNDGLIRRGHRIFTVFGGLYVVLLILLTIPFFQLHAVYVHFVKWPLFAQFDMPEKYGLAPGKAINLRLNTSDGIGLGAWFVLSDDEYNFERTTAESMEASISAALRAHPTVLFFHGNAASRAVAYRVDHYKAWTSRMGANCLAIDYRGFGDSTGSPSEAGLAVDARTAWDWLLVNGARAQDVLVVGHSLGTAVASELVYRLETSGVQPKGLLLQAPFSSLRELVDTYYVFGFFPLMKPLEMLPGVKTAIKYFLAIQYDTQAIIANVTVPLVIAHAEDDWDIPHTHSEALFDAILDPHLPPLPALLKPHMFYQPTPAEWDASRAGYAKRREKREELVNRTVIDRFGVVEQFQHVLHVQTRFGGHNPFGQQEGLQNIAGRFFGLL